MMLAMGWVCVVMPAWLKSMCWSLPVKPATRARVHAAAPRAKMAIVEVLNSQSALYGFAESETCLVCGAVAICGMN